MYCEPEFHQQGAVLLAQSGCSVWQFRNESGEGTMTTYELFPGAALSFNDFHMAAFDSSFTTRQWLFAIDYCREGRMEYTAGENTLSYIKAGDLKLDRRLTHQGRFVFPSSHYHGITVGLDLDLAERSLPQQMQAFPVTPAELSARFDLPLTAMKSCFKSMYGVSIGAWVTACRMDKAAQRLRQGKCGGSVAEIAAAVGYDSASKFAAVFKKTTGRTPVEYRNEVRQEELKCQTKPTK